MLKVYPKSEENATAYRLLLISYQFVIIAGRYGSIHDETKKSYTQMEYEYALNSGIPVLGFIRRDLSSLPHNKVDNLPQLELFIKFVKQREVKYWSNPHELAGVVSRAMHHAMEDYPRIGWVRDAHKSSDADIMKVVEKVLQDRKSPPSVSRGGYQPKIDKHEDITGDGISQDRQNLLTLQARHLCDAEVPSQLIDSLPIIKFTNSFSLDQTKTQALKEVANIVLSAGITAFSNIFDHPIVTGLPSYSFYQNSASLRKKMCNPNFTNVFFDVWGKRISGCIVASMPNIFLTKFYVDQVKALSLKIPYKKEIEKFRQSIYTELGSMFSGACSTAIAEFAHTLVRIGQSNFDSVEELFDNSSPIYVATLPFNLNKETTFLSYLILDVDSIKEILYTDDMYFNPICELNHLHRPDHWLK